MYIRKDFKFILLFCYSSVLCLSTKRDGSLEVHYLKVTAAKQNKSLMLPHLSRASLKLFLWTSNWKTVLSQSVEALSLPPCFLRKASKPFSEGYFSLPMNTTGTQWKREENGRDYKRKEFQKKTC